MKMTCLHQIVGESDQEGAHFAFSLHRYQRSSTHSLHGTSGGLRVLGIPPFLPHRPSQVEGRPVRGPRAAPALEHPLHVRALLREPEREGRGPALVCHHASQEQEHGAAGGHLVFAPTSGTVGRRRRPRRGGQQHAPSEAVRTAVRWRVRGRQFLSDAAPFFTVKRESETVSHQRKRTRRRVPLAAADPAARSHSGQRTMQVERVLRHLRALDRGQQVQEHDERQRIPLHAQSRLPGISTISSYLQ